MRKKRSESGKTIFTIVGFALILGIFLFAVNNASKGNIDRQQESLEKAIQRDVTYCYATTGRYPKTLDYMERVYGLTYENAGAFKPHAPLLYFTFDFCPRYRL